MKEESAKSGEARNHLHSIGKNLDRFELESVQMIAKYKQGHPTLAEDGGVWETHDDLYFIDLSIRISGKLDD